MKHAQSKVTRLCALSPPNDASTAAIFCARCGKGVVTTETLMVASKTWRRVLLLCLMVTTSPFECLKRPRVPCRRHSVMRYEASAAQPSQRAVDLG